MPQRVRSTKSKLSLKEILASRAVVTVAEFAHFCGVHEGTVRNWIANGEVKANRAGAGRGKQVLIPVSELRRFAGMEPATA